MLFSPNTLVKADAYIIRLLYFGFLFFKTNIVNGAKKAAAINMAKGNTSTGNSEFAFVG